MGEESGFIRFEEPDAAVKARAKSVLAEEGGLVVKKKYIATLEALTGEAERDYWSLLRGNKDKHRENRSYRGRGKHNRGGRQFVGKRSSHEYSSGGRPNKAQKVSG
ncbi:la protein 1-like [Phalaenopsis equestris]|nr:la protein 1-like [Phalaenopsis equestris]